MNIAIIHDYLNQFGGAERLVYFLARVFPDAPIYTSIYFPESTYSFFKNKKIYTSFMQRIPSINKNYKKFFFIYPHTFRKFKFKGYDILLTSSSAFSSHVRKNKSIKICYCHTPPRFLWDTKRYLEGEKISGILYLLLKPVIKFLRKLDLRNAKSVDFFISNSHFVEKRIQKIYKRDSEVIYPPIDINGYTFSKDKEDYYLVVSRLKGYKRVDIAIKAFNILKKPLLIVGSGEGEKNLKSIAGDNITFLGRVKEKELLDLYSKAKALIFTGEEDLGLAPLEAQASGTPVVAFGRGGALETIIDGSTGYFFYEQDENSIIEAIQKFEKNSLDPGSCRENALKFDYEKFKEKLLIFINEAYKEKSK
jgi:glycosyltransferase involved in cell wall biosynthesis